MARLSEDIRRWTSDILSFPIKRYYVELISMCRNEYAGQEPAASRTPLAIVASYHSERGGRTAFPRDFPQYHLYPKSRGYRFFILPRNTLLTQLTGITESSLYTYVCFYRGHLLMAPDAVSLIAYIDALEMVRC